MKKCSYCKQIKSTDDFGPLKKSKDGKQYRCKKCFSNAMRKSYRLNPEKRKQQIKSLEEKIQIELNLIKTTSGCIYCLENESCCLDFHHLDMNTKNENVSYWVHSKSRTKAIEEANKCVVVCSNCHRKIHAGILELNQKL